MHPELFDRLLAAGAALLLVVIAGVLVYGQANWADVPALVWLHIMFILVALALSPVMLLRTRGDRLHRRLGWIWAAAMMAGAALSFGIRAHNHGQLSYIHILAAFVLVQVPFLIWAAHKHNVSRHRAAVRGVVTGALLIAGFFTLGPERMLGEWLFR